MTEWEILKTAPSTIHIFVLFCHPCFNNATPCIFFWPPLPIFFFYLASPFFCSEHLHWYYYFSFHFPPYGELRPPWGVCEACLHQVHKPMGIYDGGLFKCQLKGTTIIHSHGFVMELLHWHRVCELGGDELHRPPTEALIHMVWEWVNIYLFSILLNYLLNHSWITWIL